MRDSLAGLSQVVFLIMLLGSTILTFRAASLINTEMMNLFDYMFSINNDPMPAIISARNMLYLGCTVHIFMWFLLLFGYLFNRARG